MRLVAIGLACGVVAAIALTRLMTSLVFGVSAIDPITYGVVCLSLMGTEGLASYLPASRASIVDPASALRAE